jgi:hypothetical protein
MASGFFLGGTAEGLQSSLELANKRQALAVARQKVLTDQAQKSAAGLLSVALKTIDAGRKAGQPADKIGAAVQPFMDSITQTYSKIGQDPTPIIAGVKNLIDMPAPLGKPEKPMTELGKLHADYSSGRITKDEFTARVTKLTEPRPVNTVETIRQKIAGGQALSPGEKQVYDDALKANPLSRLLIGMQNGGAGGAFGTPSGPAPVPQPAASPPPAPPPPQSFNSEDDVRNALQAGKVHYGDTVLINGQPMKVGQ